MFVLTTFNRRSGDLSLQRRMAQSGRSSRSGAGARRRALRLRPLATALFALVLVAPALAIDPPYQRSMERLAEIMGSLYFLQPLCQAATTDWRAQMAELITLDEPDEDRRQRLAGAFNSGYDAFARFHRACTPSAQEALVRLLVEAERTARDIHTRYAE